MKTALVILAAGIGARYGGGIKQLEPVGPMGEIIMDYSIHDAIAAGFDKIVFIIRRDMAEDFRHVIGNRIEAVCAELGIEVAYAFQELEDVPQGVQVPAGRTKPWGTGQALLACREVLKSRLPSSMPTITMEKRPSAGFTPSSSATIPKNQALFVWPDSFCAIPSVSTGA